MGELTAGQNRALALCKHQGTFAPCPPDQPCENCGCPLRGHFQMNASGYATACSSCRCEVWCCVHGGQRVVVKGR